MSQCSLLKIIAATYQGLKNPGAVLTYRRLDYLNEIYQETLSTCGSCKTICFDCPLKAMLIRYNFNTLPFINYQVTSIMAPVSREEDPHRKINLLAYQLKVVQQAFPLNMAGYHKQDMGVRPYMIRWLKKEIGYLDSFYPQGSPQSAAKERASLPGNIFKIPTSLPLPHIAGVIRTLIEMKVFEVKKGKITEVITFFAHHMEFRGTDDPSPRAFRNAFYMKDETVDTAVSEIFQKGADRARKRLA